MSASRSMRRPVGMLTRFVPASVNYIRQGCGKCLTLAGPMSEIPTTLCDQVDNFWMGQHPDRRPRNFPQPDLWTPTR